jgi:hypothetical protein
MFWCRAFIPSAAGAAQAPVVVTTPPPARKLPPYFWMRSHLDNVMDYILTCTASSVTTTDGTQVSPYPVITAVPEP